MRPEAAKNERDRNIRAGLRKRVLSEVLEGDAIPNAGIFPGLGDRWKRPREEQTAVLIPAEFFPRLTEKIVRGIFYVEDGKFIEPPYKVDFFAVDDANARELRETLDRFGQTYAREPGVVVRRAVAAEDGISSLFEIEFWKQFKTYAVIVT
jgi:hypothetical protein